MITRILTGIALSTLLFAAPASAVAADKGADASSVTLILDFPLAFLNNLPQAASSGHEGDHAGHGDHAEHGGHQHGGSAASHEPKADSLTVAHKTFQDRLLVFRDQRITTVDGLRYSFPADKIEGMTADVLTYFRRSDAVRNDAMAITFGTAWKMVGVVTGGKEKVLKEGTITGGVRDFSKGGTPSPEIAKVKHEVNPKSLPALSFDDIEARLGMEGKKSGSYRLELRTSTDMTAMVEKKGKGSLKKELTAFTLQVIIRDGRRSQIDLEFPYSRFGVELNK